MSGASLQSGWRASRSTDIRPRPVLPPPGGASLCALASQTRRSAQRCCAEPGPRIFARLTWAPALQRTAEEALRCVRGRDAQSWIFEKSATARVALRISLSSFSLFSRTFGSSSLTAPCRRTHRPADAASPSRSSPRQSLPWRRRRLLPPAPRRSPSPAPSPRRGRRAQHPAHRRTRACPSSPRCRGCCSRA